MGDTLLAGYRVLDLTDEKGHFCGKVLGDFGADVIKIEKPGGDSARGIGPFYKDEPNPERSLSWYAMNTSKRGITLDLEKREGQQLFKQLVSCADFVIESFSPGYLDGLGLGYSELEKINPEIIMTAITPYGQTGPYSEYATTDLTASAMGGLVRILGELNRPPVRMSCDPQAYYHAGVQGAVGSMMAHYHRILTGEGQHVDVSIQEAMTLTLMSTVEIFDMLKVNLVGMGQFIITVRPEPHGMLFTRLILPCKDGYVFVVFGGGSAIGVIQSSQALLEWANEEGMALELKGLDFSQLDLSTTTQEESDHRWGLIQEFIATKTKAELYEESIARGIMMAPCNTIADLTSNAQLEARGFWEDVEHSELGRTLSYPGAPLKMDEAPWRIQRRAPLIGEHNHEIYEQDLGIPKEEIDRLHRIGII